MYWFLVRTVRARSLATTSAVVAGLQARFRTCLLRCRVRVAAERVRNVGDGLLRPHAVARIVERRRNDGDAELARRDGNDTASDPTLGRQSRTVEPLTRVVVEPRGRHDREDARHLVRIQDALAGDGVLPAGSER